MYYYDGSEHVAHDVDSRAETIPAMQANVYHFTCLTCLNAYVKGVKAYSNQSTAMMMVTSSAGSPTVSKTITMVTKPAWGIPAAPILAAVAVTLKK